MRKHKLFALLLAMVLTAGVLLPGCALEPTEPDTIQPSSPTEPSTPATPESYSVNWKMTVYMVNLDGTFQLIYSTDYNNQDTLFDYAAMYHNAKGHYYDTVETVEYAFDGEVVITHTRWSEPYSYEPAD